jgi:hypothetical protein
MTGSVPGAAPYAAVTAAKPSADLCAPRGLFLLARQHAVSRLHLDTRDDLAEARQLYAAHGYREVAPFNDGRFADHWYGKILG